MRIYLDTSVFSAYYDEKAPERLTLTRAFWDIIRSHDHERICSDLTLEELKAVKTPKLRDQLLHLTRGFSVLKMGEREENLARDYLQAGVVTNRHFADALHIAIAVLGNADILVSWNFQHLVRRSTRYLVNSVNALKGLRTLEILAPPEV